MRGIEQKISDIGRARKIHAVRGFSKKMQLLTNLIPKFDKCYR
jgi:hypothetical protein